MAAISPECRKVCARAAELLGQDAESLWAHDSALAESWEVEAHPSTLLTGIRELRRELLGQSLAKFPYDGLPEVVTELLKLEATSN